MVLRSSKNLYPYLEIGLFGIPVTHQFNKISANFKTCSGYIVSSSISAGGAERCSKFSKRGGLALFEFLGGGVSKKGKVDFFRMGEGGG